MATLAARHERKAKSSYTPTAYAHAALLVLLGFNQAGCIETTDLYGGPTPTQSLDAGPDAFPKDVPRMVDAYGVPTGDAYRDSPPLMDTALPADTAPSNDIVPSVDAQDEGS